MKTPAYKLTLPNGYMLEVLPTYHPVTWEEGAWWAVEIGLPISQLPAIIEAQDKNPGENGCFLETPEGKVNMLIRSVCQTTPEWFTFQLESYYPQT